MHWNHVYLQIYRPGMVDYTGRTIGKIIRHLLLFSPYLFMPYILYRKIDTKPEPFIWTAILVIPGAFLVFHSYKYLIARLQQWKNNDKFRGTIALYIFLLIFQILRVWSVQAGFSLLMNNYPEGMILSKIFACLYVFLLVIGYWKRPFFTR